MRVAWLLVLASALVAAATSVPIVFDKLHLKPQIADSLQQVSRVADVALIQHCAQLCAREAECGAVHHDSATQLCYLLKRLRPNLEVHMSPSASSDQLTEVWRLSARSAGAGKCPSDFTLSWGASRYKLSTEKRTWTDAERRCQEQGGSKLAELTSKAEIDAVFELLKHETEDIHVGGRQSPDGAEPAGGWMWYPSGVTIPSEGFVWQRHQPNNYGGSQDYLAIAPYLKAFHDLSLTYFEEFLCECFSL